MALKVVFTSSDMFSSGMPTRLTRILLRSPNVNGCCSTCPPALCVSLHMATKYKRTVESSEPAGVHQDGVQRHLARGTSHESELTARRRPIQIDHRRSDAVAH